VLGHMKEMVIDETTNPFTKKHGGVKISSLFFTRQGDLYATGSNGVLYRLLNRETNKAQWNKVADIGSKHLTDNAIDANGNIYLSSDSGVWKVPFDNSANPYKLGSYESYVSAIVVDNNRNVK
jgi:hypothetical protein